MKRDRLLSYLLDADDKKVTALYNLFEEDIKAHAASATFSDEHLNTLDRRREELISGKVKGIGWEEMHNNIRNRRGRA